VVAGAIKPLHQTLLIQLFLGGEPVTPESPIAYGFPQAIFWYMLNNEN